MPGYISRQLTLTTFDYLGLFRSINALFLEKNTNFLTFWSFWAPQSPFEAPQKQFMAEPNRGSLHFIIVHMPRARGNKNLERISQNMIVLGKMVFFELSGCP